MTNLIVRIRKNEGAVRTMSLKLLDEFVCLTGSVKHASVRIVPRVALG